MVRYYDAENADLVADLSAYVRLAERFGGPVLDVGCGTGRVAFHLAGCGLDVTGLDLSPAMLDRARQRVSHHPALSARLTWIEADVTRLALDGRYHLAVFAYNGFMHLLEPHAQIAALQNIARHLTPGGGLALDLSNPIEMFRADDTAALTVERIFADLQTGQTIMQQSVASLDRARQTLSVTWVYDRLAPDGLVHRDLVPLQLRYTFAAEMRLLLAQAGFDQVQLYGDYDFNDYEEASPRLFVVAVRAETK